MYRTLSLVFLMLFCFACNNAQTQQEVKEEKKSATQQTVSETQKVSTEIEPKSRVIMSTARPKSQMEQHYPFDIDLKTAEGKVVNSAEVLKKNGKPTIVLFWLTTCIPCRMELNAIKKIYEDYAKDRDFNMIAISTDFSKNYDQFVKRVNESGWKFEAYNDMNREFRNVMPGGLNGLPQTFIFDADGNIVYHKRKYRTGDEIRLFEKAKAIAME